MIHLEMISAYRGNEESQQYCTVPATQCCMCTFVSSVNSLHQFDCLEAGKETFLILPVRMFVEKKWVFISIMKILT